MFDRQPSRPSGDHASIDTNGEPPCFVIQKSITQTLPRQYSEIRFETPDRKSLTRMFAKPSLIPAHLPPQLVHLAPLAAIVVEEVWILLSGRWRNAVRCDDKEEKEEEEDGDGEGGGANCFDGNISFC